MEVNYSDKGEQRKFGIVMAVAITVLGAIRWALHGFHAFPKGFLIVAAVFLVLGIVAPRVLKPVLIVWMKFALAMNWVMTRVILTVAFFVLMIPAAMIMKLTGKDPLNRAWDPNATTYWEAPEEQPAELERYYNQF